MRASLSGGGHGALLLSRDLQCVLCKHSVESFIPPEHIAFLVTSAATCGWWLPYRMAQIQNVDTIAESAVGLCWSVPFQKDELDGRHWMGGERKWGEPGGARVGPGRARALHVDAVSSMTAALAIWKQVGASLNS